MAKWGGYKLNIYSPRGLQDPPFDQSRACLNLCAIKREICPRKVDFGLDSELVGRTNCTTLYNNLSRMMVSCQDVLRLNTLYTVPKNFLCGLPGRNFFDHEGRGGGKGSLLFSSRARVQPRNLPYWH